MTTLRPITRFPYAGARSSALSAEGTFIDGMKVLFDVRVELTPADLVADTEDEAVSSLPAEEEEPIRGSR